jgi:lipopolysaccharide transport system permease protein
VVAPDADAVSTVRRRAHLVDLGYELVLRDIRLRYRGTVLGVAWSQVAWLEQAAMLAFIFGRVVDLGVEDYPAFVLVGMLSWTWFSGGLAAATTSVVANRDLVRRPAFDVALLPTAAIAVELVQYVLALPVVVLILLVYKGGVPGTAVVLPVIMAVQVVVMFGPAFVFSALHVRYRDTAQLVGVGLGVLFYASAVFFPRSAVPDRYKHLFALNPVVWLVESYRHVLLDGRWPSWGPLALVALGGAAATVAGWALFRAREPGFPDDL